MGGGSTGGAVSDINVTPLIDVLLVLLIIFMVIVPVTPRGLETLVPQPPKEHKEEPENTRTIVVTVRSNGAAAPSYLINETTFAKADLEPKLAEIFATRQEKVMFVKGDDNVPFFDVANVIDIAHASGVDKVGLITAKIEAGQ